MKKVNHYNGITKDKILQAFEFRDGKFYWKISDNNFIKIGQEAGTNIRGVRKQIKFQGKRMLASRMAFLCYYGWLPEDYRRYHIDHEDHDLTNNKKDNLRCVTVNQNQMNRSSAKGSTSNYLGVCWCKDRRRFVASIQVNGKTKHLGRFESEIEAAKVYDTAARKYFKEFANPNFKEAV